MRKALPLLLTLTTCNVAAEQAIITSQPQQAAQLAPVTKADTLWQLASRARPDNDVAMVQVVYALWQANPQAFRHNNANALLVGQQLSIPSREQMLATDEAQARRWYYQAIALKPQAAKGNAIAPSTLAAVATALQPDTIPEKTLQQFSAAEAAGNEIVLTGNTAVAGNAPPTASVMVQTAAPLPAATTVDSNTATDTDVIEAPAWYQQVSSDYTLTLQHRYYPQTGMYGQAKSSASAALAAEWYWEDQQREHSVLVSPLLRWDQRDSERNLVDIQQAFWQYVGSGWDIKAGVDIVFWGVTESQHLVDVINQTDLVASVDGEAKLGQPMLNWNLYGDGGTLNVFLLPYFRERTLAGPDGRLRMPMPVETDNVLYEAEDEQHNLDIAVRWSRQFGSADLGLSYFAGNNRDPGFIMTETGTLQPFYVQMQQLGLDGQWISGSWIWKLESIYRNTKLDDWVALTAGFEYTRVGVFNSNWDIGWISEYQFDSRDDAATSPGQNDVFVGARVAVNDTAGSEILLGVSQDLDYSQSRSGKLEASMRLNNAARLRLDAWFFQSDTTADPLFMIKDDDFVQLSLDYYF